ncbi:MAG: dTDP-4-dehydrorhamnose reductase [Bacteroidales bacterium]|nr:dTDP-4-dehydrorhamnose reductase [Bacteroidales bacterium]
MNVLITGAGGQLGRCLREMADQVGHDGLVMPGPDRASHFVFTDVTEGYEFLDITDASAVNAFVKSRGIQAIVNCAAYTNVEKAEEEPELAEKLNAGAVAVLASAMKEVGGLLIHISTDYVFGGKATEPYPEDAPAHPSGVYARTKRQGEEAVMASGARYVILRTAWLYSEYGKNFVKTMLRLTAEKPSLKVVNDQKGTPTYAGDLAEVILRLLEMAGQVGHDIYHYTNAGECTWYEFAKTIAAYAGHTACDIQPCTSDEFPSKVHRPAYSVLDKSKIKEALGIRIPHWTESLQTCLERLQ